MLIMGSMTGRQMWHLLWFLSARKLLSLISDVFPSPIFSFSPFQHFSDPRHSGIWRAAYEQMPLVCCVSPSLSYFPSSVSHTHIDASSHVILNHVWLSSLWADLLLGFVFMCSDWDIVAGGRGRGGWGGRGCGASWVGAVWRRKGKKKVQACHLTPGAVVSQLAVPYTFIWPLSSAWEGRRPEERGKRKKLSPRFFSALLMFGNLSHTVVKDGQKGICALAVWFAHQWKGIFQMPNVFLGLISFLFAFVFLSRSGLLSL